jgi:phosphoglucosamine mutase
VPDTSRSGGSGAPVGAASVVAAAAVAAVAAPAAPAADAAEMARTRLFGTDGVRGLANKDLTAELALELAVAAAHVLGEAGVFAGHRPLAVVGRDPRASGEFLEAAVVAGLAAAGVDVLRLGILPTPAVAYLTAKLKADLGVMLSASHNPMPDNGIKFFARGGHKLADHLEDAIEARLLEYWERPTGADVGRIRDFAEATEQYVGYLLSTLPHRLDGLTVVIDCANGAAYAAGPEALRRAGATVVAIGCDPDGLNINDGCGSTHLEKLTAAVLEHGADVGIAHDGDADRCLAVAADGSIIDGDQILAILSVAMHEQGRLTGGTVVATVMSNLGFRLGMEAAGINVIETAVGDRYVLEAMKAGGYVLGGEQSGHVVLLDHATTGDGILTALQLLGRVAQSGRTLVELAAVMNQLPQVLVNVTGVDKSRAHLDHELLAAVAAAQAKLGAAGRILLRPSGTEPVVRVMVEAATREQAEKVAGELAGVVRERLG